MATEKQYAIIRHTYQRMNSLARCDSHNLRKKKEKRVDPTRSHLNKYWVFDKDGKQKAVTPSDYEKNNRLSNLVRKRIKEHGITGLQEGQGVLMELTVETSPEWYQQEGRTEKEIRELAVAQFNFIRKKFGNNLISADWHRDEKTPHWHFTVLPLHVEKRKIRQSKRQKEAGEPVKYSEVKTLSIAKTFTPEALEQTWTEYALAIEKFGFVRGEFRRRNREHVTHMTLKQYENLVHEELPKVNAELEAKRSLMAELDQQIREKRGHVQFWTDELSACGKSFMAALKTYYQAAETSPRLADWQRVQRQYDAMPETAQNALQDVLQQGAEFDQKQISPYRLKR